MLVALCAVLGYIAIDLGSIKITFESLPILLGALLFGPADGALIGGLGTLIYQILRYGISVTTVLWMLPYILIGYFAGLFAKRYTYRPSRKAVVIAVMLCELLVTVLNTGVLYLDSIIYGYYYKGIILGMLAIRLVIAVVKGGVFGILLPVLMEAVFKSHAGSKVV